MPESPDYYRGAIAALDKAAAYFDARAFHVQPPAERIFLSCVRHCNEEIKVLEDLSSALPSPIEATPGPDWDLVEKLRLILDKIDNASCTVGEDFGDFGINVLAKQGLDAIDAARQARGK